MLLWQILYLFQDNHRKNDQKKKKKHCLPFGQANGPHGGPLWVYWDQ